MNLRALFSTLFIAGLFSVQAFSVPAEVVPAMVALDKKYIPALGLSGQPDQLAQAKVAFLGFQATWDSFRLSYSGKPGFDAEWAEDLERVNQAVVKAKLALVDNNNGPAAHEALEGVRMAFLASRTRQKVPYFIDQLTLYHNSMEDLLNNVPAKKLPEWTQAERLAFAADLDVAIARWSKVKAMEGLLPAAALAPKASEAYATQWQAVATVMAGARKALDSGDAQGLQERLAQLKPNFIKTFFLFGDFPK